MAHPYQSVRDDRVAKSRAKEMTKACGGSVSGHAEVFKKTAKPAMRMTGGAVRPRLDRPARASGGRVKKPSTTNIHINVTPSTPPSASPPSLAGPAAPVGLPVPRPAPPPMPGPMAGPPGGPPGLPPGMPPMPRAKGGRVAGGPLGTGWKDAEKNKTKVQHMPGNADAHAPKRSKPITYATGGSINAPSRGGMGPKMPGGGRGGLGRLAKAAAAKAAD
jgi:hypothetical protein